MQNKAEKAPDNIFLVGLMGAGKTTVGKVLAQQLKKTFFDADHEIENRTGVKIPVIFEIEGEDGFRERESRMLQELAARDGVVVATGGGAILRPANRELLKRCGIVVYLKASVNDLWLRTRHDKNRPLLQCDDPRAKLSALFDERDILYQQTADIVVNTGNQSVKNLVQQIEAQLTAHRTGTPAMKNPQESLSVALGERSYPIEIGLHLLQDGQRVLPYLAQKRVAIVTNTTVAPLYLETLRNALTAQGVEAVTVVLPDGEAHKNWETLNQIFDALLQHRCERKTTLIALGGGVIGDLTGFAAATYLRGVPFIQIPTTLLAQVDSSVGGKTGINHPLGKNMIGAFYQPRLVLADIATLNTLPGRELAAGIAEVIKYGLIRDLVFFEWLEQNITKLVARDPEVLAYAIRRSCENKAEVVTEDEHESGVRALLNLGHTFGHAIEAGMGYGAWLHGEAVAAGTVLAVDLSRRMGLIGDQELVRIKAIYRAAGLPIIAPDLGVSRYLELMGLDKKVEGGKIRFVLLKALGEAFVSADVPSDLLLATLTHCGADA